MNKEINTSCWRIPQKKRKEIESRVKNSWQDFKKEL
jgi:hypothetical protein